MENLKVKILNREYQLSCPPQAKTNLQQAVAYLNSKMAEISKNGKIISFESMLVTAAINLSYELIEKNIQQTTDTENLVHSLTCLEQKLHSALQTNNTRDNASIDTENNLQSSNELKFEYNNG
jgi:cell division protein ZapA